LDYLDCDLLGDDGDSDELLGDDGDLLGDDGDLLGDDGDSDELLGDNCLGNLISI
jgi:hypothetical protein